MSLWPDGFRNPVFPLGFHWYPRWEELLITAGQGQEFYLPTKPPLVTLSLGMIDIPCNFSPHGSTDVTDSVTSLLLSGGEGPTFLYHLLCHHPSEEGKVPYYFMVKMEVQAPHMVSMTLCIERGSIIW